ncbi:MAG: polyprenyl diphosphate synthase [Gammaproteobacteria bacterium]|nr:polyprenyl diphosphate synthase [Gammaproteobacteria bacterium]
MSLQAKIDVPVHVAIIMDGNGRWAEQRGYPRVFGHRQGATALRTTVRTCAERGVRVLTVFAFSSENWRRPSSEVGALMQLFLQSLRHEVRRLHEAGVRLRFIGERSRFDPVLQARMAEAEELTASNERMTLVVAVNYGGRWDITQAARALAGEVASGRLAPEAVDEITLVRHLALGDLPEPDLLIRTGGEQRISNFLLWQLAYAELYFTPVLWPDFDAEALDRALAWYAGRERRFGQISAQLQESARA